MVFKKYLWDFKGGRGLTPLHFTKILIKLTGSSSPALRGSRLSQLVGDAVRGQKSLDNQRSRAKEKVTWNLFFLRFFIYYKKSIHRIPSPHMWGEG